MPHLNYPQWHGTVKSLIRNTPEGVINRIFIIDQSDQHRLWDKQTLPAVTMIHTKNLGFAKAMNTGIRLSDAPYVMCLNDDVTFINKRWWYGIESTFRDVPNALCVNPGSICDPDGAGGKTIMAEFDHKDDYDDDEYTRLLQTKGGGWIDGICMWAPVFKREMLDKVPGVIPGKAWFDERFYPGGGEDYDLNRRAFLSNMRCLGTNLAIVWHHWHGTTKSNGSQGAHHDGGTFKEKWSTPDCDDPDVYGQRGLKEIPLNILREE